MQQGVSSPDWQVRDAVVLAFGSVLEGPSEATLQPLCVQALTSFLPMMKDPSPVVRDSIGWLLGHMIDLVPNSVDESTMPTLLEALYASLDDEPRVAKNICWTITSLVEVVYEAAQEKNPESDEILTYGLSGAFGTIVAKLLEVANRPDAQVSNLRVAVYEALMSLIQHHAKDCYPVVQQLSVAILGHLQSSVGIKVDGEDEGRHYTESQALLCATMAILFRQLEKEDALKICDQTMQVLLSLLMSSHNASNVIEDALLAISALIEVVEMNFAGYLEAFYPILLASLENHREFQVCSAAVGVVGDLSRALTVNITPYCDEIMNRLMTNLADPSLDRSVKPQILSCFSDIASAIGPQFKGYVEPCLSVLQHATVLAATVAPEDDFDMVDQLNELREGCLEAYNGMLVALKGDGASPDLAILVPHVNHVVGFISAIVLDRNLSDSVVRAALGLIGDLCATFGQNFAQFLQPQLTDPLMLLGMESQERTTKQLVKWCRREIKKIKPEFH